jgi:hypothetical protein
MSYYIVNEIGSTKLVFEITRSMLRKCGSEIRELLEEDEENSRDKPVGRSSTISHLFSMS